MELAALLGASRALVAYGCHGQHVGVTGCGLGSAAGCCWGIERLLGDGRSQCWRGRMLFTGVSGLQERLHATCAAATARCWWRTRSAGWRAQRGATRRALSGCVSAGDMTRDWIITRHASGTCTRYSDASRAPRRALRRQPLAVAVGGVFSARGTRGAAVRGLGGRRRGAGPRTDGAERGAALAAREC